MKVTLYHNPRCSKSRQALELLQQHGIEPEVVLYLQTPLNAQQLSTLLSQLAMAPTQLLRFKESRAEELGLQPDDKRSTGEWINILAENPVLMERPIMVRNNKACIGRPPENILTLL